MATLLSANTPRLLVTTDIGGDPDDQQSLIRLLLYANEIDIAGIVASASGTPGELGKSVTRVDMILDTIADYARVLPNLRLHDPRYPDAELLRGRVKSGNPLRGPSAFGAAGHDTEGSAWIAQTILAATAEHPLHIAVWGGQTDLAQALWRVGNSGALEHVTVYDINDQDRIFERIRALAPTLRYTLAQSSTDDKRDSVYRGVYLGGDESLTSADWIASRAKNRGNPLGERYPMKTWTAPNPHSCMKEGDTPSWFAMLPNGLNFADHPEWGGWGGRFTTADARTFRDAADVGDSRASVHRWRPAFQNAFHARLDWCVLPYAEASHFPVALLNNTPGTAPVLINAAPGQTLTLSAAGSRDPDHRALTFRWWQYPGIATLIFSTPDAPETQLTLPADAPRGAVFHIILDVTNNGTQPLTSYRRAVITIQ